MPTPINHQNSTPTPTQHRSHNRQQQRQQQSFPLKPTTTNGVSDVSIRKQQPSNQHLKTRVTDSHCEPNGATDDDDNNNNVVTIIIKQHHSPPSYHDSPHHHHHSLRGDLRWRGNQRQGSSKHQHQFQSAYASHIQHKNTCFGRAGTVGPRSLERFSAYLIPIQRVTHTEGFPYRGLMIRCGRAGKRKPNSYLLSLEPKWQQSDSLPHPTPCCCHTRINHTLAYLLPGLLP